VVRLQQGQAERLRDVESRGQQRIRALRASLPKETSDLLERLAKLDDDATAIARSSLADTRKRLLESTPTVSTALHPGLVQGRLLAPHSVGWFTPYYGTLHGSDGSVYWQGYNPGTIKLWDSVSGSGPGLFGTGAGSFTVYMDWWFTF